MGSTAKIIKAQTREIAQQMSQACLARRLRQVNRTVTRLYDDALRPHGLTINQLNILAVIISEQHIRPGQLGQTLGMEKSTVSRTVDRMVGKGWLQVSRGQDSRTQVLSVTTKGHQLLLAVTPIWDNLQANILTHGGHNILTMLSTPVPIVDQPSNDATGDGPTAEYDNDPDNDPVSADDFYL
ncbi:MAG: winged helix-turn-helix transcriptional regulator [Phormidesmis sp. RL_2_1]|nr:winged helix-turn-helix transcriptional regulator [Phormidesmis sp. RL_2_1]